MRLEPGEPEQAGQGGPASFPPASFPSPSSNNSTGWASSRLSTQQCKAAAALAWNVAALARKWGLGRLGFLTLTFGDSVMDGREAQRRFNSLATHVLRGRYLAYIRVVERQKSGRIHYHLIVVLPVDIRTGFDFKAVAQQDYRSASAALRAEWAFWRKVAPDYGFGRTELLPIRSTVEGIARYVGKYIGKHLEARQERDKGLRLVEYSQGARMATTRFSWASPGAAAWRRRLKLFTHMLCQVRGYPVPSLKALRELLGPRWAYHWREFILSLPDPKTLRQLEPLWGSRKEGGFLKPILDVLTASVIERFPRRNL